jgi:hypothetical protein
MAKTSKYDTDLDSTAGEPAAAPDDERTPIQALTEVLVLCLKHSGPVSQWMVDKAVESGGVIPEAASAPSSLK